MEKGEVDSYGIEQHDHEFREHVDAMFKELSQELLAERRFEMFVKELATAMDNTHKNLDAAAFSIGLYGSPSNYYEAKGRAKAWGEIYDRFTKEVGLAMQRRDHRVPLDDEAYIGFRVWKNKRVDTVLPEDHARGNRDSWRLRGRFADSMEDAMYLAYRLGKRNGMFEKLDKCEIH